VAGVDRVETGEVTESDVPRPNPADDLEYDLAHEVSGAAAVSPPAPAPTEVVTQTTGYDGDYGYDLAHEVPGR